MIRHKREPSETPPTVGTELDRLQAILNSMDDGVAIVGRDYRIEFMNLSLRSEMGDGEGRFCFDFFGHDRANCEECQHGMSSFGPVLRREWTCHKTGKIFDVSVAPLHKPDGDVARLHILRDITERKRLESQLQEYSERLEAKVREQAETLSRQERLALLGEIAAGLAHEIRTPLGAILTGIRLLEKGGQPPDNERILFDLLKKETARLDRKVTEFLGYARKRTPQWMLTSVAQLLQDVKIVLQNDPRLLGSVTIQCAVPADLPPWPMDPDQIKEALLNIGQNALQALQGSGTLRLEAKVTDNLLEIFVYDDGPGIPMDILPQIFRPFFSRRSDGTGLGLAICREIVEAHGGRIAATSVPGRSTVFRIALPFRKTEGGSQR